jgi:hypothetical protein
LYGHIENCVKPSKAGIFLMEFKRRFCKFGFDMTSMQFFNGQVLTVQKSKKIKDYEASVILSGYKILVILCLNDMPSIDF